MTVGVKVTDCEGTDRLVLKEAVFHQPFGAYAYPLSYTQLCIRLRARKGDLKRATVLFADRYSPLSEYEAAEMEKVAVDELFDYFSAVIALPVPRFRYLFHLDDGREQAWYSEEGFLPEYPVTWHKHFEYPYIDSGDILDIPAWAADAVWYEIFPERFANGDPANDPPGREAWLPEARPTGKSFFGGDLKGIIDKLPYLAELGVTGLYLTPVFLAPSTHKYDTTDYYRIDPHFGDEETARAMVDACHRAGIRVVLDAVFNHCGYDFFAFADVRRRGRESPYADWFIIHEYPVKASPTPSYETWGPGIASLPKLRTDNPAVQDYLLGVARHWTERLDIDGWRLDVANEVNRDFWRRFRKAVRAVKPDALIVGEVMHRAQPWLGGDQFDAVMNYPFRRACVDFFARGTMRAAEFDARLAQVRMAYPEPVNRVIWNLLDSHDTPRFVTECGFGVAGGSASAAGDEARPEAMARAALAAVFQFTYVGAPMIYYGNEIGMEGGADPDCRRPMRWDVVEQRGDLKLFQLYRRLVELRRGWSCLRRGGFQTLAADSVANVYVFARRDEAEEAVVAINNGPHVQQASLTLTMDPLFEGVPWQTLLQLPGLPDQAEGETDLGSRGDDGVEAVLTLKLAPYGALVLGRRAANRG